MSIDGNWYAIPDGSSDDLHQAYLKDVRESYLAATRQHFAAAEALLSSNREAAEVEARASLDAVVRAFWWSERRPEEPPIHDLMHELGRWVRETFGCQIIPIDGVYEHRCPVVIAHKRFGLSPGFVARRYCSLCGEDLSECDHLPGTAYLVPGGVGPSGVCPVCTEDACADHHPEETYRVSVTSLIKEILVLEEVSLVDQPVQPEARLTQIPLSIMDVRKRLGPRFVDGMSISCDKCLNDCWGFTTLPRPQLLA